MTAHRTLGAGRRFVRLPATERRRVLEAALELTRSSLEFSLFPESTSVTRLGTLKTDEPHGRAGHEELREAQRVGQTVARVARRLPWQPTCLRQALAVQRMLRRRDIASRLHLGVTSASVGRAHAWVTVEGHPVIGSGGVEGFVPLAAFE